MKKTLAILVSVIMLLSMVTGALAQPAKRNVETKAEPVKATAPVIGAKTQNTKEAVRYTLDEALNISGGAIAFTSEGDYPWTVVEEDGRVYAMSSNAAVASSTSTVTTTVTAAEGDYVFFDYKAWGEGTGSIWDKCIFMVDDTTVFTYGAVQNDWETFNYALTAGEHVLTWTYSKDSSVNPTGDYFAIDNVSVGAPANAEAISVPAMLEVPMYRSAQLTWTVLPENAIDKSVTFSIADTSIATVNETGLVSAVALGTTTLTVTSVAVPTVSATVTVKVYDAGIVPVQLYGNILFDPLSTSDDEGLYLNWITFYDTDPVNYSLIGPSVAAYGETYAYGNIYGYNKDTAEFFILPFDELGNTEAYTYTGYVFDGTMRTMSINYADGIMYGIGTDANSTQHLYGIDMVTGSAVAIGDAITAASLLAFAIDIDGNAFAIGSNGNFYSVDLGTAALTLIGSTGCTVGYIQDMCFNYDNGELLWALCNDNDGDLMRVDTATGAVENLGEIGGNGGFEIGGLFMIPADEPLPPSNIAVTGVEITPTEMTIRVDDTAEFVANVLPLNADNKDVVWSSSDENVVVVDQNGTIIGVGVGTATITVTTVDGGFTATATVTVLDSLGNLCYGWYFETDPIAEGWTFVDKNEDGKNWTWQSSASSYAYEGVGVISSDSYSGGAITPDNWAVTPGVMLPNQSATFSFFARGRTSSYYDEHFQVYIGTSADVDSMVAISGEEISTYGYEQYMYDVSAYAGQLVYFAIRHFNCNDVFTLYVDQVEVFGKGVIEGAHTLTINYIFEDGTEAAPSVEMVVFEGNEYSVTSPEVEGYIPDRAVVTGTVGNADITVTVTYTPDDSVTVGGWYFETDPVAEGWTFVDSDGDGFNWVWQQDYSNPPYCTAYEGEGLIFSESYDNDNGAALTPDNWAISPAVTLPTGDALVYLYACGQDASYAAEHFAIYVGTSQNVADMVQVSEEFVATGEYVRYEADLTAYAGQTVYIAIRHFNVTDMFMLNIDNVVVKGHDNDNPPTPALLGDVDCDGEVTFSDITLLCQYINGVAPLTEQGILNADMDENGDVTFADVGAIYQFLIG